MKLYFFHLGSTDRRGVALVITLIMLAIVTVFSVAFLSVARRERTSVAVKGELDDSRNMSEIAQARAQAETLGRIIASSNIHNFGMLVSVNQDGAAATNVATFPVTNIAALSNDARVPVYVDRGGGAVEFPYYLDLNRNATNELPVVAYDTNAVPYLVTHGDPEWIGVSEFPGEVHSRSNRFIGRYAYVILPLGRQIDVNVAHNNAKRTALGPFTADGFRRNHGYGAWEYNLGAFLYQLNSAAGAWPTYTYNPAGANGGVAFVSANSLLFYRFASNSVPTFAFDQLYPFTGAPLNIDRPLLFQADGIDGYSDSTVGGVAFGYDDVLADQTAQAWVGSPSTNRIANIEEFVDRNLRPRYADFHFRLTNIMNAFNVNTNDRNTFYRLIEQLGPDSAPAAPARMVSLGNILPFTGQTLITNVTGHGFNPDEWVRLGRDSAGNVMGTYRVVFTWDDAFTLDLDLASLSTNGITAVTLQRNNRIHLNYNNLSFHETNFVPWTPAAFFTNVADRLLRMSTNYGMAFGATNLSITNIPLAPTNHYTPRVHQLLQVAANLYDASTNTTYPSIFRPIFFKSAAGTVQVAGYEQVIGTNIVSPVLNPRIALGPLATNDIAFPYPAYYPNLVMFGVPPVVGAKKFMPNFNEFSMQTKLQAIRRLQVVRANTNAPTSETNQMFFLGLTNAFAAELWHPYDRFYPNPLNAVMELTSFATLSNEVGYLLQTNFAMITNFNLTVSNRGPYGFTTILPATNHAVLPLSVYRQIPNPDIFERVTNNTLVSRTNVLFERGLPLIAPQWYYTVTNRLFYAMVDSTSNVVVDIVAMDGLSMETNLIDVMTQVNPNAASGLTMSDFWRTGPVGNVGASPGMLDQIRLSRDFTLDPRGTLWRQYNAINVPRNAATNFDRFLTAAVVRGSETNMQAPFSPAQTILVTHRWQVDDPFVHYMASDYQSAQSSGDSLDIQANYPFYTTVAMTFPDIGVLNKRYRPWGGNRFPKTRADFVDADEPYTFNPAYKDPMIRWPDEWDFPTNKFGNVGWIGRVHRGTPWQTIYLKSGAPAPADWENRVGSVDTYPTNDWAFADLFTVHVDDNARRGLLSVNQHNSAAWAAVLAGMPVLITNLPPSGMFDAAGFLAMPQPQDQFIVPDGDAAYSGVSNEFTVIVEGINRWRAAQTNGVFTNIGSILGTPELSLGVQTNSPYIGDVVMAGNSSAQWRGQPVSDPMAERIPQQLLSLVTLEGVDIPARFAVYGWGQSLSPAPRSLVTTPGATFQLCTNYQVTGETLTKTIFRLEPRIVNTVPGGNTNPAVNLQLVIESFEYLQNP